MPTCPKCKHTWSARTPSQKAAEEKYDATKRKRGPEWNAYQRERRARLKGEKGEGAAPKPAKRGKRGST